MNQVLPANLAEAEKLITSIIKDNLEDFNSKRLAINLRFEGLRISPLALRLANKLLSFDIKVKLLWSDAGSVALAKRDMPNLVNNIFSFTDIISEKIKTSEDDLLIAVSPQPFDYELFELLPTKHDGKIIMLNGKLEDTAVGIGSIGRDRRRSFIGSWEYIYSLEPFNKSALMKLYPFDWSLFRLDEDGYRYVESFKDKPDQDLISETLFF